QTARLVAIEQQECTTDREIVLVGAVDMNRTMRSMLDQVADRVTSYIHAPQEWADRFDEHGCLIPQSWESARLEIAGEQVRVVDGPADQVDAVVEELATWGNQFAEDEIVIGAPDETLVLPLRRRLSDFDVQTQWPLENILSQSRPFRLLESVADYLHSRQSDVFAHLIRHPDLTAWLDRQDVDSNWLIHWDRSCEKHGPQRTDQMINSIHADEVAIQIVGLVDALLTPLCRAATLLRDWAAPIREFLFSIFGDVIASEDDAESLVLLDACASLVAAFAEHESLPLALSPTVTAAEAIELTLDEVRATSLKPHRGSHGLRLSGWLDVPLDDSAAVILTSLNEGLIPSSVNHDLFLPNRLRVHLGIEDNSRRYARDCHALTTLLASRGKVRLIVARRNANGDPLAPSRLLFATDPDTIAKRVLSFFGKGAEPSRRELAKVSVPPDQRSQFKVPLPVKSETPKRDFYVTEFRNYLVSPYRYYLKHIAGLREVTDGFEELDAGAFGDLIHAVLNRFGESAESDLADAPSVAATLSELLDQHVADEFGVSPPVSVLLQVEQARLRLKAFAPWQAGWRAKGWEIRYVEQKVENVPCQFAGGPRFTISGRIDRIDYHPGRDAWAIFDYKTGEKGLSPEKTHRHKKEWVDFQLPLYRHLAKELGVGGDVQLAYLVLPRDTNDVTEKMAEWTSEELLEADEAVSAIVQKIQDQEFWEELTDPPEWLTEYDAICQQGIFGREVIV
ncbi:MAG: PD-(D/E)XK nuclease family protein, partial [Planctomycetaceae bacterium]|nr:PD-(D/E)XK nuclease family protein [Planctomycetaceae bacterium]